MKVLECNTEVGVASPASPPAQFPLGHLDQLLRVFLQQHHQAVLLRLAPPWPQRPLQVAAHSLKGLLQHGRHLPLRVGRVRPGAELQTEERGGVSPRKHGGQTGRGGLGQEAHLSVEAHSPSGHSPQLLGELLAPEQRQRRVSGAHTCNSNPAL